MKPGVYQMSMTEYLALPAVNHSLLQTLLDQCPRAAWYASWLNPERPAPDDSDETDVGSIAHAILLEGNADGVCVIDPKDHPAKTTGLIPKGWTNQSIRAARDKARIMGQIPVLAEDMAAINAMVWAATEYVGSLRESEPAIWRAFQPDGGDSELTMLWDDGGTLCRMRPDRISKDRALVINYKTTSRSAAPERWGRAQLFGEGHYIGAAWYRRGIEALCGVSPAYVYLVQETAPPYLCSLVGVDPKAFEIGAAKAETALREWRRCVERGIWPAYPRRCVYPELPPWEEANWQAREAVSMDERLALASQA